MSATPLQSQAGNCARFAARPLTEAGTPTQAWREALANAPELDLAECAELVIVAAHPDDETFGLGATATTLAGRGVRVQVVVASSGGAAHPGSTPDECAALEQVRIAELREATEVLGLPMPICLDLPDGALSSHESRMARLLGDILEGRPGGTWCAANWRGDGHPDHEAVGRAAAVASARSGATLLEYPVWMWHWASADDTAVPWDRLCALPVSDDAVERKTVAAQCYRSQFEGTDGQEAAVLPPFVIDRLLGVGEVVFR